VAVTERWVLLSGGVGGAKLALGLDRVLPPGTLTVIANTGDDFRHLGLAISPDIDTLLYTLAGTVNPDTGWGRRDESWQFMAALTALRGEDWFRLGDRDLAVHIERTRRLGTGETLTAVTRDLAARWGIRSVILPMSDAPSPTRVVTRDGTIAFQDYFVRRRAEPVASGFDFGGAPPTPEVLAALTAPGLRGILIAPSNPWLSIEPLLALAGMRAALIAAPVPIVAVSPIVGGAAIKGPTAKIMRELGMAVNATSIARHYGMLVHGIVLDERDRHEVQPIESLGLRALCTGTVMRTLEDKTALALTTLGFARSLER
jgi:LPPG:FO 2-phospho-L-lactate transferase